MNRFALTRCMAAGLFVLILALAGCGGGGNDAAPPTPPPPSGIGAAGGTVTGPSGAQVVVPAGALATPTTIVVAQSSAGAPALPAGVTSSGQMFAFTPHGTAFAVPVTITVPFDPARVPAGAVLALYKTNAAQTAWIAVPGATVSGSNMSGAVSGFSYAVVAPQPPEGFPELTEKSWRFDALAINGEGPKPPLEEDQQTGGTVDRRLAIGEDLILFPDDQPDPPKAQLEVHSSENGKTFWTIAQAPRSFPDAADPIDTSISTLEQNYTFKVRDPNASLKFIITAFLVEAEDNGGNAPSPELCPYLDPTIADFEEQCAGMLMFALDEVDISAHAVLAPDDFFSKDGVVGLAGSHDHWFLAAGPDNEPGIFHDSDLDTNLTDLLKGAGPHAFGELKAPITVAVPLSSLQVGDTFNVRVYMKSFARNQVQGESYVEAAMRDPVDFSTAASIEFTGLEQLPVNHGPLPPLTPVACANPDPTAGQFEFGAAEYRVVEGALDARVEIRRVGGSHGMAKVLLDTVDGSALAGSDYVARHLVVPFADGESGGKFVNIPLVVDHTAEPDETVQLRVSPYSGCATLGARSSATLDILDNDRPVPVAQTHTIGGTVNGLTGSGLVLRNVTSGALVNASGSSFTFPAAVADGSNYNVVVATQPASPLQSCSVAHGSGTVAGANVTDIAVTCTSPPPSGSLDPTFGNGGRVASSVEFRANLTGARIGMALQGDGKILMVGGLKLLRFNADGSADPGFGTAGVVNVVLNNGALDTAMDVAVLADGRILVVGTASTLAVGSDDFALVRYNSDGTVDTTFGTAGKVLTDFFGSTDQARRLRIQADGKIIVIGSATQVIPPSTATVEFAIARYNADGSPDTTFSSDGKTVDSPGSSISVAKGVTIQNDGKIVVAGSTASSGGAEPDLGFVRYIGTGGIQLPGDRDNTFGFNGVGVVQASLGGSDEVVDVVTLDDGTILGAVQTNVSGAFAFGLAHLPAVGFPAPLAPQPLTTFTTESDLPHCMLKQADGKIVVVGQAANLGANPDMAVVRYNDSGLGYDQNFGTGGLLTLDFFGGRDSAEAIVQQPDGKLVIGGYARSGGVVVFAVTRLAQ